MAYWQLLFPRPYWTQLDERCASEWAGSVPGGFADPAGVGVQSRCGERANAYGLMQLLPSTGKTMAKKQGERHFTTNDLLNPTRTCSWERRICGSRIDRYSGQVEYALAAYNAGDTPVQQWMALNNYKDIAGVGGVDSVYRDAGLCAGGSCVIERCIAAVYEKH